MASIHALFRHIIHVVIQLHSWTVYAFEKVFIILYLRPISSTYEPLMKWIRHFDLLRKLCCIKRNNVISIYLYDDVVRFRLLRV